jgi:hypothetical protein
LRLRMERENNDGDRWIWATSALPGHEMTTRIAGKPIISMAWCGSRRQNRSRPDQFQ